MEQLTPADRERVLGFLLGGMVSDAVTAVGTGLVNRIRHRTALPSPVEPLLPADLADVLDGLDATELRHRLARCVAHALHVSALAERQTDPRARTLVLQQLPPRLVRIATGRPL
jgi:hypothetical protein